MDIRTAKAIKGKRRISHIGKRVFEAPRQEAPLGVSSRQALEGPPCSPRSPRGAPPNPGRGENMAAERRYSVSCLAAGEGGGELKKTGSCLAGDFAEAAAKFVREFFRHGDGAPVENLELSELHIERGGE